MKHDKDTETTGSIAASSGSERLKAISLLLAALFAASLPAAADDPKADRAPANRLAHETSPYLLLHAHNPVDWYPWGPDAFAKAKAQDKPIFLSIGYSSCYWCHVMERESFKDPELAKQLNASFVCIKVDREERPDVDQIYMTALQAFGHGGGWPLSMFLTPDGRPFFGGTYFPPKDRDDMPSFARVLKGVADAWRDERKEVEKSADSLAAFVRRSASGLTVRGRVPLSRAMAIEGRARIAEQYDPEHGGFGFDAANSRRPKFPEPSNLFFLLDQDRRDAADPVGKRLATDPRREGPAPRAMVLGTLDGLARGGIRDALAGGYHRYSVVRSWMIPHFEKMLYDNAQIASALVLAFEATGDPRWRREAKTTYAFVARSLTSPEGGFYSALDAETDADEGGYYVWTREEVQRLLSDDRAYDVFAKVYGLDREANFDRGRYVLYRPRTPKDEAEALGTTSEEIETRLAPLRAKLLATREKRPAPLRDDKILTAWNGLMIAAYAEGARVLKDDNYRRAAERAADFLLAKLRTADGRLLRTYRNGQAKLPAYLEDYAFLAHGLLRLHAATGDARRLAQAKELADRMIADFGDAKNGGFFYTAEGHESLLARIKDPYDNALPSGNSVSIRVLLALAAATGDERYREQAREALEAFSPVMAETAIGVPLMLVGLLEYLDVRPEGGGNATVAEKPSPKDQDVVRATATVANPAELKPGGVANATVTLTIKDGWHLTANPAGAENLKPTVISAPASGGATVEAVDYPAGTAKTLAGERMLVYEGTVSIKVRLRLDAAAKAGPAELELQVRYQACNDRMCLAPAMLGVPLAINVLKP